MAQGVARTGAQVLLWFLHLAPLFFATVFAMAITGPFGLAIPIMAFVAWRRRRAGQASTMERRRAMLYGRDEGGL